MLLLTLACASAIQYDTPIPAEYPWERAEPTAAQADAIAAAQAYAESEGCFSLLVIEGEQILHEAYFGGHSAQTPWPMYSATKTFSCPLAWEAIDQGLLSMDESAADTLTEWQGLEHKQDIRVEHLLRFTSGLESDFRELTIDGLRDPDEQRIADKYAHAIELPSEAPPGEQYVYGSAHLTAFGALMSRKLDGSPVAWLQDQVLDVIGMRFSGWNHDAVGNPMLSYGAWTSTPEMARFGVFLRDDGAWEGEQVVAPGLLDFCMSPTPQNPAYGVASWINGPMGETAQFPGELGYADGPIMTPDGEDMLVAGGARGQRIYVMPERDWVVVQQCDSRSFRDTEYLQRLLDW